MSQSQTQPEAVDDEIVSSIENNANSLRSAAVFALNGNEITERQFDLLMGVTSVMNNAVVEDPDGLTGMARIEAQAETVRNIMDSLGEDATRLIESNGAILEVTG